MSTEGANLWASLYLVGEENKGISLAFPSSLIAEISPAVVSGYALKDPNLGISSDPLN